MRSKEEELEALKNRVISGNNKLFLAWFQIRDIEDKEEKEQQLNRWNEAQQKLHILCQELTLRYNYNDCLYLDENGKKTKSCLSNPDGFFCQVCPSTRRYWEQELMSLPGPKARQTKGGEVQAEFLRKLGGVE